MKLTMMMCGAATVAMLAFVACSSDDTPAPPADPSSGDHDSPYPACAEIIEACHPFDIGEGPLHDCHTTAHEATSEAPCLPIEENCVKICSEATADAGADAGEHDE